MKAFNLNTSENLTVRSDENELKESDANCDTGSGIIILLGHCKKSCSCIRQTKGDQIHPLAPTFYQILKIVIECFKYLMY